MPTGPTLGTAFVEIVGRTDKFSASVEKGVSKSVADVGKKNPVSVTGKADKFGQSVEPGIVGSVKDIAKKAALAFGAAFVVTKGFDFAKSTVGLARDLNESLGKVNVVFGESADEIIKWASTANTALGSTRQQALEAAGTFGNLFQAFGLAQKPATEMSKKLVELATDLASFNNSSVDEALIALRSGLSGETEPLKRFGIALSDVRLKDEAVRIGLIKTAKGILGPAVKAQAAYSLILHDTALAQGDFARTSGGLANQQRILSATFKDIKTQIGSALLPAVLVVTKALAKGLPSAFDAVKTSGRAMVRVLGPVFREIGDAAKVFFDEVRGRDVSADGFLGFVGKIGGAVGDLATSLATFSKGAVGDIVDGFKGLPEDGGTASKFFHAIGDAARGLVDFLTGDTFAGLIDSVKTKLGAIADDGGKLIRFFQDNSAAADVLKVAVAGLAAAVGTLVIANKAIAGVNALKTSLAGLQLIIGAGPIGIFAAAVVAIGVAGFVAYKKFKPFRDLVDNIGRFIARNSKVFIGLGVALAAITAPLVTLVAGVALAYVRFKGFRDVVNAVGLFIGRVAVKAFDGLKVAVAAVGDAVGPTVRALTVAFGAVKGAAKDVADFLAPVFSAIGRVLGPVVGVVVEAFKDLFGFIVRNAPAAFRVLQDGFRLVGTIIGGIVDVVGSVTGALADAFGAVVGFLGRVGAAVSKTAAFKFLVDQVRNFASFIQEIAPQVAEAFGHVVAAIRTALEPLVIVFKATGDVVRIAVGVIIDQVRLVVDVVRETVKLVAALWSRFGGIITGPVRLAFRLATTLAKAGLKAFTAVFGVVLDAVLFLWRKWGDDLGKIIKGVFAPIVAVVKLVVNTIANVVRLVLAVINGDWAKAWEAAKRIVLGPIEAIKTIVTGLINVISGVLGGLADTVSGIFHNAFDAVSSIAGAAFDAVVDFVVKLPGRILGAAGAIVSTVAGLFGDGWDGLTGVVSAAIEGIVGFVTGLPGRIVTAAGALVTTVKGLFGDAWDVVKRIANAAIDNIVDFVSGLPARIGALAGSVFNALSNIGSQILEGLLNGLKAAGGFAGDVAKAIGNALIDIVNDRIIGTINKALDFTIPGPGFLPDIKINPPDIPNIPRLASGGLAKRNTPVTAVIGDNRFRDEIVAPMPPGFAKAMEIIAAQGGKNGDRPLMGDVTIIETNDGRGTFTDVVRAVRSAAFLVGLG